jgi:hypothetical protein
MHTFDTIDTGIHLKQMSFEQFDELAAQGFFIFNKQQSIRHNDLALFENLAAAGINKNELYNAGIRQCLYFIDRGAFALDEP